MPNLIIYDDKVCIEIDNSFSIYLQDHQGRISLERFTWIDKFLGVKQVNKSYEVLLCLTNGTLAKWIFDQAGFKLNYHSLDKQLFVDIAHEFKINTNIILPELSCEFQQNELAKKYFLKAEEYLGIGKYSKAEYYYFKSVAITTNNYHCLQALAKCLSLQKKFNKALEVYLFSALKYPEIELNVWHFEHKLISYVKKTKKYKLFDESIKIFERIISITNNKNSSSVLNLLGELYWYKGEKSKALQLKALASTTKNLRLKNINLPEIKVNQDNLRLPDFLVIGPQKSGTTALYQYLTNHPHICPASVKEIFFFDSKYDFGINWYKSHFPFLPEFDYLTGEASATYFNNVKVVERIAKTLPNVKLIFTIRDPVDRAISDYHMKLRQGLETRTIEEAINSEIILLQEDSFDFLDPGWDFFQESKGYVRNGLYLYFLRVYLANFDPKNTILINSQKLLDFPRETMRNVFEFLEVEDYNDSYPLVNKGNYSKKISQTITNELSNFFEPHNQLLEKFLDYKLNWK